MKYIYRDKTRREVNLYYYHDAMQLCSCSRFDRDQVKVCVSIMAYQQQTLLIRRCPLAEPYILHPLFSSFSTVVYIPHSGA